MSAIDVRFASLDVGAAELAGYWSVIDADERTQAERFRQDHHRRRFIARRALRRLWLGDHVGMAAANLRFDANPFGKPHLRGGPHFSASHSGEMMMLAVADRAVGCDIEGVEDTLDWPPIAARFFAAEEVATLAGLTGDTARRAFFDCWARKEAFVKAIGKGVSHPLDAFVVSVTPAARLLAGGKGWAIEAIAISGHACAIVTADSAPAVRQPMVETLALACRTPPDA